MGLRTFSIFDYWVPGPNGKMLFGVMVFFFPNIMLVIVSEALWKTRFWLLLEYRFVLISGRYRGDVMGFTHYLLCVGFFIMVCGYSGLIPGVVAWNAHFFSASIFGAVA